MRACVFFGLAWRLRGERVYDIRVAGCPEANVTLNELRGVLNSQEAYWENVGQGEPFWSVLSSPEYAAKKTLDPKESSTFYQTGEEVIKDILVKVAAERKKHLPWSNGGLGKIALDFGCGVGRLATALARRFLSVICLDHSRPHLDTLMMLNVKRILPFHSQNAGAELHQYLTKSKKNNAPEFVLSILSLQHMIPQLQAAAIEHLCDALDFAGTGFIQTLTFYSDAPYIAAHCNPSRATAEPGMHLHYLPLDEVFRHLELRGCSPLSHYACDHMVSIPNRNSTSHCIIFLKKDEFVL